LIYRDPHYLACGRYAKYIETMVQTPRSLEALHAQPIVVHKISVSSPPGGQGGFPYFLNVVIEEGENVVFDLSR
jgi:hypothetical protein